MIGFSKEITDFESRAWEFASNAFFLSGGNGKICSKGVCKDYIPNLKLKKGDVVICELDMKLGQASFSINGKTYGIAYKNETLKEGKWYPTVELVYKNDQVTFLNTYTENLKLTTDILQKGSSIL